MKNLSKFIDTLKKVCFCFVFFLLLIYQTDFQMIHALPLDNYQDAVILEELRLSVPCEFKEVWLKAEKQIWDPWLAVQNGFLGREIFWDRDKEEALILVKWKNKKLWKSISMEEVNEIQEKFEDNVKDALNQSENPFKLIYEGELVKQV